MVHDSPANLLRSRGVEVALDRFIDTILDGVLAQLCLPLQFRHFPWILLGFSWRRNVLHPSRKLAHIEAQSTARP